MPMPARSAGAPRLIEWTGERCVPWAPDAQLVYEHLHRYLWAAELVAGHTVLDLASGEGFGAAILAQAAQSVVGVDIDARSVEHASLNYLRDNLSFTVGDARDLSRFADDSFDFVVAFELIEHVAEQDCVIDEIERVLTPRGVLVMSTPDRRAYVDPTGRGNALHVRALGREAFLGLAQRRFRNMRVLGQRTITGTVLAPADGQEHATGSSAFIVERAGEEWRMADKISPGHFVMLASNAELPSIASYSTLGDCGLELVTQHLDSLRDVTVLRAQTARDAESIRYLESELQALRRIEESVTWQILERVRGRLIAALGGPESRRVRFLQRCLRLVGGALRRPTPADRHAGDGVESVGRPEVSIVMPVYSHVELTRAALESIRANTNGVAYEVILVDDDADLPTKALLRESGCRVIVNEQNAGYLQSVNRGVAEADGQWVVLCNSDIEVRPGWLTSLLDCASSADDIAIVAPKYLFPDGRLAEAGSVVWRDAVARNYGRGDEPGLCRYNYRREIDYGSAAALLVKAAFWREVGGFDQTFEPMYYEDTDLCFEARRRGFRVMYEPRAEVIHVESVSAGTDLRLSHRRYLEINRRKFAEKWEPVLEREHSEEATSSLFVAADRGAKRRALIVDRGVPTSDRDSGSLRMRRISDALLSFGWHVLLLSDEEPTEAYLSEARRLGVHVTYGSDVYSDLREVGPALDVAILSRPEPASRWLAPVREHAPSATAVYDAADLRSVRESRRAGTMNGGELRGEQAFADAHGLRQLELAMVRDTDATLVLTDPERDEILEHVPDAVVHVIPDANEIPDEVPPVQSREGVLFVGAFLDDSNVAAASILVRDVMPRIWEGTSATTVKIVGPAPPPEVKALASPLVDVTGWVEDLEPLLYSARVLVAPLTYPSGTNGEITRALACGLPVVTTPIGADGLSAVHSKHLLLGETSEELAESALRVLTDADLWQALSRSGRELAAERWSPAVLSARLESFLYGLERMERIASSRATGRETVSHET